MKISIARAALALGLLLPTLGVAQGTVEPQSASPAQSGAAVGNAAGPPVCRAAAVVTYVPATTDASSVPRFEVAPQKIEVAYPEADGAKWAICWTLVVGGADPTPFNFVKLEGVDTLKGDGGMRVLFGDTNFQGRQSAYVIFNAQPKWNGGNAVSIKYGVVAQLSSGTPVELDPEIIIKKPGG